MSLGLKGLSWHFIADSEIQFSKKMTHSVIGSAAARADLKPGDHILEINGLNVRFVENLLRMIHYCTSVEWISESENVAGVFPENIHPFPMGSSSPIPWIQPYVTLIRHFVQSMK